MKIKKGDTVQVIAGKDKGAKGKVIHAYPDRDRILVEGVNRIKKHTRISQNQRGAQSGGIVTQEAAIHVSNVMLVDSEGKPTRVGKKVGEDGKRVRATKSIAQFKLREGMPIGAKVTLRNDRMWEFLDRLLTIALPRIRDFRGLSPTQFDGRGNYTFGLNEQSMFHEINPDSIDRARGMDITVVTTATTDEEGRALLRRLGFPFREN